MFKFAIVEFEGDMPREVEIVCHSWLVEGNLTYWPNCTKREEIYKILKNEVLPDTSWQAYSIRRILCTADNFQEAKKKLMYAEETSDFTDSEEMKRKKKKPKRLVSDEEYENEDFLKIKKKNKQIKKKFLESDSEEESLSLLRTFPKVPKVNLFSKNNDGAECCSSKVDASDNISPPVAEKPQADISVSHINYNDLLMENSLILETEDCLPPNKLGSEVLTDISNYLDNGILAPLLKSQEKIVELLNENNSILKALAAHCLPSKGELYTAFNIPFTKITEIEENEEKLKDKNMMDSQVNYLSLFCGMTVSDTTRHIMRKIFNKEIAFCINWAGRGGKKAFSNMLLKDVVVRAVLKCHESPITIVEECMKRWLKNQNRYKNDENTEHLANN